MFVEESVQEITIDIDNYNEVDQSLEQSLLFQSTLSSKDKQTPCIHSNLNPLLEQCSMLAERESAKRVAESRTRYKKLKQKLNFLSEQILVQSLLKDQKDVTSPNKSRLLKLALELEKSIKTQAVDYQLVEALLREIQKIVEHRREHDLLILRGARAMTTLLAIVKRFPSLHRTEASQSMASLEMSLRLLRIMLSLSSSREWLLVSNQLSGVSSLLSCVLMREERKIASSCLGLLNAVLAGPIRIQLCEIVNANLEYMLCSSLLKRLKSCLENCLAEDDPAYAEFVLLGFKFYYLVLARCCQKQTDRPIYGTPVMDNLSRAISGYFENGIQLFVLSVTQLVLEKEAEGQQQYVVRDEQIPNFKINILLYIFKCLNIIFHVNVTLAQKVIECNSAFLSALLFTFEYVKICFKESQEIKNLCSQIIIFIGNLACQNLEFQTLARQSGILNSLCNHPLQYMMQPLKHIFVPTLCSLIHNCPLNYAEAFRENSVLTILQYIEKQINCINQKRIEDQPCLDMCFLNKTNQCKTLSRKTSVSSMNSNYSKASMAESYTTQASVNWAPNNRETRLDYKFRPEYWEETALELRKIDD